MTFGDYAPPSRPSAGQQRDALRKGLGRAAQWASAGRLDEGRLLAACLTDQRQHRDFDDVRSDWLWRMIQATGSGSVVRFRAPVLQALRRLADPRSADQLCGLARCYAGAGDGEFRARLAAIVERKPIADRPWLGEEEVVALDGEEGFVFIAGARGRILARDELAWDERVARVAEERFGAARVGELLTASDDEGVRQFRKAWDAQKAVAAAEDADSTYEDDLRSATPARIVREAVGDGRVHWFRFWGRQATPGDLATVLDHLWDAKEPKVISNLLGVLSDRALPEFDARLVGLGRHADDTVRQRAFNALAQNSHPLVREFALAELAKGTSVLLFVKNFESGDEDRLLAGLKLPSENDELHWLLRDIVRVLEAHPEADASRLGVFAYAKTTCGECRFYAAEVLDDRDAAPDWLRKECRHDAGKKCRAAFGS